ncbi:MAG: O-antigen ligase family protein [Candidatus Contendobacter sp.]|jgi:teichuronic acid biosynthesis protein TuaE|nr:O-antigen ligase family protein [Gammaproteobacteria bacterium]MCC8993357.1 O-antigen ligase family protein [Candidatus Contendobacter sp.]
MPIKMVADRLQTAFWQWGWLLPTVLPLAQLGGRALYTVLISLYALWGLPCLWQRRDRLDRVTTTLYLALLSVILIGIPGSVDPESGLRVWGQFIAQSLTLLLMQAALRESPAHFDRLLNALALSGLLTLVGVYLLLLYHWLEMADQRFDPSLQLREDNLPFLLPFLLYWLWRQDPFRRRFAVMVGLIGVVIAYVVIAEGRAALLGLIVGLMTFFWLALNWRLRWIALLAALALIAGIAGYIEPFQKAELDPERPLSAFTKGRSILWQQALEHPPARPWLGVGIGNEAYATEVLSFTIGGYPVQVKHLHNFLLDAWYETGLLGVGLLLALIGTVLIRLAQSWRRLSDNDRQRAGILLAAALALMTAGLLSFSYTSRQLACYLFLCLGGLSGILSGMILSVTADTDPDRH